MVLAKFSINHVTQSKKTRHSGIFASLCSIYVPKALFCVNIKSVLQVRSFPNHERIYY